MGVAGSVELLATKTLSSQPLAGFDWSPDKVSGGHEGLTMYVYDVKDAGVACVWPVWGVMCFVGFDWSPDQVGSGREGGLRGLAGSGARPVVGRPRVGLRSARLGESLGTRASP
jgi:hypothetical protein